MANALPRRPLPPVVWLFFGLRGRVSRSVYWLAWVGLLAVNGVLVGQMIAPMIGEQATFGRIAEAVGPFIVLVTLYANIAVGVKRLHDVGYSGFLAVALVIPLVNLAFTIWVGILPGTPGPNPYGTAPDRPA